MEKGGQSSYIVKCLVYPTAGTKSQNCWFAVPHSKYCGPKEGPFWADDLDFTSWFPRGASRTSISYFPGTDVRLPRTYHIFTTRDPSSAVPNMTLLKLQSQLWMGNIVVVADHMRSSKIVQFPPSEIMLLDSVVTL